MSERSYLQALSETQQRFIAGAESMGATSPSEARAEAELPRISARELQELLDTGIVREGGNGSYYVYLRARPAPQLEPTPAGSGAYRALRVAPFLIIIVAVPIIFLRCAS